MKKPMMKVEVSSETHSKSNNSRRKFLKMGGLAVVGSSLLLYGCSDDDDISGPVTPTPGEPFDLGSGDVGILNYAYALEQLEAEFYTQVIAGSYFASADPEEKLILQDLYDHEVIHREFFKAAITGAVGGDMSKVLPELEFDFSGVDFGSRDAVLGTAQVLEDTGVSAYNGAGARIELPLYLTIAGKIVSVEARHAAAIRSIYLPGNTEFAGDDVIDANGLDPATPPADVLAAVVATGFLTTPFTANNLPAPMVG
ncbi:ferritin-like domain-containing protein [Gillisia hiemivivida]|nr:ferritin-like domain-containing protein [Gillisia hiemivivida]